MKLLMFHVREFWFRSHERNLETEVEREEEGGMPAGGILAWVHAEPHDTEDRTRTIRKAVKNLKWLARKVDVERVTLHSFAHLAKESAEPEVAQELLREIGDRLRSVDFEVHETPWGYFNEFKMHVEGPSLAKVWIEF
ncbi:MAG: threonyl-tRNA synthetase editing domain-containing protein [Planctomycetota bacterium]